MTILLHIENILLNEYWDGMCSLIDGYPIEFWENDSAIEGSDI